MRTAGLALAVAVMASSPKWAHAEEYRRPGLEGKWSRRHLTMPLNAVRIIAGPGQPMLMGQRYAEQNVDGGGQYVRPELGPSEGWVRGGVGFGLTKDWEAGALFLPFKVAPEFQFAQITVFVTRGFRFENWDIGVRFSFQTPRFNEDDLRVWILNPGVPILFRSDPFRFDAGVFVPIATRDGSTGLTVPLRASVSVSPHVFVGLESGFAQTRFSADDGSKVPFGALAGYTLLFGGSVVDLTAMFSWDSFFSPGSSDAISMSAYRVGAGMVLHTMVK